MTLSKIVYFDRETIKNILQEKNKGSKTTTTGTVSTSTLDAKVEAEASAKLKLEVPIWARLAFLFSGRLAAEYTLKHDSEVTITSTEISDFERIKESFNEFIGVQVADIESSSTFFRLASGYLRMMRGGVEGVDIKEFKSVLDSFEGYDTYRIRDDVFIRFNNTAFVSNYKRNDLLTTKLTIYCIKVGVFSRNDFDFVKQIEKMQTLANATNQPKLLSEIYPPKEDPDKKSATPQASVNTGNIELYDVVYACVVMEE